MDQASQRSPNHQNKPWHHQVLINHFATDTFSDSNHQKSLDSLLFEEKMHQHVKLAMQSLEPKQRAALILYYYQKYSQEQVAEILGMTVMSLQAMLDNVRKKLQRELAKLIISSSKIHQNFNQEDLFR
jgi:RNA polymerase sigma factor (sigma-70 family)